MLVVPTPPVAPATAMTELPLLLRVAAAGAALAQSIERGD